MARLLFALGSIVCASGIQALFVAACVSTIPNYEGGLESLLPSVLWLGGTVVLALSAPLWVYLFYERWRDFDPRMFRYLLFVPWVVILAVFSLLVEAVGVGVLMALRS